jgi:hypothetical protein
MNEAAANIPSINNSKNGFLMALPSQFGFGS